MNSKENIVKEENTYMSNQEYREELRKIFDGINENYKLRWFYSFVREKLRSSNKGYSWSLAFCSDNAFA